jgi:hypothetical protein
VENERYGSVVISYNNHPLTPLYIQLNINELTQNYCPREPTISLSLWTFSYQWAKSAKDVICVSNDFTKTYYIPARNLQSITRADLNKYKNKK